ncbi:Yip1 family protein [Psychroserpens sp.]|uniref:Yip1 family protein n=1 Tax=Psychroserpens sp. TaxID=2020870 RepID=UPI001B202F27|nr:Yip1 family protein [Psychroserpens sp.]MBO6607191.1 YIP1 family protein [Psychroserpens sp.]MBO6631295.1 YIP1 family protein [Psychroserpens sp.]MBO6654337.1 YIP1 family protein [Psychroserpens sp.]MBO6682377.1 YIP1 family protein [Psychroserpens sp.]MBO6750963.1 YIP1 family protein [Psychroserpens sp.]
MTENNFEEFESEYDDINPNQLVYSIWVKPKRTLKYILEKCPTKYVILFLILGGIARAISRASERGMGDTMSTASVLIMAILTGGLIGWIAYFIYAWALSFTGKWLNGKSDPETFRTIIAWSLVPTIASIILLIPELIIIGDQLFKSEFLYLSTFQSVALIGFGLIELALWIWSLVILVIGIKIIQGFGTGKAILNMLLPALVLFLPLLLIFMLFSL